MNPTTMFPLSQGDALTIDGRTLVVLARTRPQDSILSIAYASLAWVYELKDPSTGHILDAHLGQPSQPEEPWPLWRFDTFTLTQFHMTTAPAFASSCPRSRIAPEQGSSTW